jgi:hypothetical protein
MPRLGIRLRDCSSDRFKVGNVKENKTSQFSKHWLVFQRGEVLLQLLQHGAKRLHEFRRWTEAHTTHGSCLMQEMADAEKRRFALWKTSSIVSGSEQTSLIQRPRVLAIYRVKSDTFRQFAHRKNLDGTIDTICRQCIATVATVNDESELLRHEQQHICNPVQVERFSIIKPPSSAPVEEFEDRQLQNLGKP